MEGWVKKKLPDVGGRKTYASRNGGTGLAVLIGEVGRKVAQRPVRIDSKAVFEVNDSRLGIGTFNRPLLDAEARSLRRAWKQSVLPGLEDFQIDKTRVSFVSRPEAVPATWASIDGLLASASLKERIRKVS